MPAKHSTTVVDNVDTPNAAKWNADHVFTNFDLSTTPGSYIMHKDGVTTYAKNGKTGVNDFFGLDSTVVTQTAIDGLTSGLVWVKESVGALGTLTHKAAVMVLQELSGNLVVLNGAIKIPSITGALAALILESNKMFPLPSDGRFIVIQPSAANTRTALMVIPKGTPADAVRSTIQIFNTDFLADATNYEAAEFTWETIAGTPVAYVNVFKAGTGTLRGFKVFIGGVEAIAWDTSQRTLIGTGTPIAKHISASVSIDFPSIPANSTGDTTVTVTGAALGDSCYIAPTGGQDAGLVVTAFVTATDTVAVRAANVTGGAINQVAKTYRIDLWRH